MATWHVGKAKKMNVLIPPSFEKSCGSRESQGGGCREGALEKTGFQGFLFP
jgi:hypothetical protein